MTFRELDLYLYFETFVEFNLLFQEQLFNTNPDYYNPNSSGTIVDYQIQFSTAPVELFTATTAIYIDPINGEQDEQISNFVVSPTNQELLDGALPKKVPFNDVLENVKDVKFSNLFDYWKYANSDELPLLNEEVSTYYTATQLLTRYDSATDLTDVLFLSNGTITAMTNESFVAELERIFIPDFYTTTGLSGFGVMVIKDCHIYKYYYDKDPDTFKDSEAISISKQIYEQTATSPVYLYTAPPLVYVNTDTDLVYTSPGGNTASCYIIIDFGSTTDFVFDAEDIDGTWDAFIGLFKTDETGSLTHLIAASEMPILTSFKNSEGVYTRKDVIDFIDIKLNIALSEIVII